MYHLFLDGSLASSSHSRVAGFIDSDPRIPNFSGESAVHRQETMIHGFGMDNNVQWGSLSNIPKRSQHRQVQICLLAIRLRQIVTVQHYEQVKIAVPCATPLRMAAK